MKLLAWGRTDLGRKRDHNEDSYLLETGLGLFVVADGMGGHQAGEQASRLAVEVMDREVKEAFRDGQLGRGTNPGELLSQSARTAGAAIYDAAQASLEMNGMGTTLTALLVHRDRAYIAHVGDSRCYLFRDGRCVQLTDDHSWVSEQLRAGLLTEEEAKESRFRHVITRSVGFEREVQPDANAVRIEPGDCFLLCSDGLSNYLEGEELAKILSATYYSRAPELLVEVANDRGGDDNVTVLLVYAANDAS